MCRLFVNYVCVFFSLRLRVRTLRLRVRILRLRVRVLRLRVGILRLRGLTAPHCSTAPRDPDAEGSYCSTLILMLAWNTTLFKLLHEILPACNSWIIEFE